MTVAHLHAPSSYTHPQGNEQSRQQKIDEAKKIRAHQDEKEEDLVSADAAAAHCSPCSAPSGCENLPMDAKLEPTQ